MAPRSREQFPFHFAMHEAKSHLSRNSEMQAQERSQEVRTDAPKPPQLSQRRWKSSFPRRTSSSELTCLSPKLSLLTAAFKVSKSDGNCFCHIMLFSHTHEQLPQSLRKNKPLRFMAPDLRPHLVTDTTEGSASHAPTSTDSLLPSTGGI